MNPLQLVLTTILLLTTSIPVSSGAVYGNSKAPNGREGASPSTYFHRPSFTIAIAEDIASPSPRENGHAEPNVNGVSIAAERRGEETLSSMRRASVWDADASNAKLGLGRMSTPPRPISIDSMISGASNLDPAGRARLAQDPIVANVLGFNEVANAGPSEVLREDLVAENVDVFAVDVAIDPRSDREEVALAIGVDSMVSDASNLDPTGDQFSKRIVASKRKLEQTCAGGKDAFLASDAGNNGVLFKALKNYASLVNVNKYGSPVNCWNVGAVTDFYAVFWNLNTFNQDISSWETGQATNMREMFYAARKFNQPLSSWNTSQVNNMREMFTGAEMFNQDISLWNTGQVTNMKGVFTSAKVFNQPLSSWDTGQVTDMGGMFQSTYMFNQPLSSWDTSQVTDMQRMFGHAKVFNQPLSSWDTSQVNDMHRMFIEAFVFNQPLSSWDIGQVTKMESMFYSARVFYQELCLWGQNWKNRDYTSMFWNGECPHQASPWSTNNFWCTTTSQADCPIPSESPSAKPSTSPTESPTTLGSTDVWQIIFTGLDANFTAISDTELSLKYDLGKNPTSNGSAAGRYKTKLYEKDCSTELSTSGAGPLLFNLTDNGRITKSPANNTFDEIKIMYNVNKTAIASSSVWNSTAKEIEVCQVIQLIEESVILGEMVIVESKLVVSIEFDLDVNISLGVGMGEGTFELASGYTNVDDYVTAYKCNENFDQDDSPLKPNEKLLVCIESNSTDVEIKEIETMNLTQVGATNLPIIVNSTISSPQITRNTIVSSIKQVVSSRVPINLFTFANGQSVDVKGKIVMQLDGSSARRLQSNSGTGGTEAAAFDVKVTLQPEAALTNPGSTDVWQIAFTGLDANFTADSDMELSLKYDIGKNPTSNGSAAGRYKTKLYEKDCSTELPTSGAGPLLFNLTDIGRITKYPDNNTFDEIKLMYNVNKMAIAMSSVWNASAKEIEVCQVIQLIEDSVILGEMVIVEADRIVSTEINRDVNILLGVGMGEGTVELASGITGVDDYVTAYKCNENFDQDDSPLVPNEMLSVCIESNSTDVKIKEIETMTLTQFGATNLPIIVNSTISSPQITGNTIVSSIKQVVSTRAPINLFTFANGQSIDVEGNVVMQLDGSSARRLQANSGTEGVESVTFAVRVTLQPNTALADGVELYSSASIASRSFISLGVALALVAW